MGAKGYYRKDTRLVGVFFLSSFFNGLKSTITIFPFFFFFLRYAIPSFLSIPEKVERTTQNLILSSAPTGQPTLGITYFSAALIPFALPPVVAKGFGWPAWGLGVEGVNSKLGAWLLDKLAAEPPVADAAEQGATTMVGDEKGSSQQTMVLEEPRIRGWTFLDYYSESEVGSIVPLLVECNFRGRKEGEEGW